MAAIAEMLSAMLSVLPPICRVMLISAAGCPSPATMRTWSSVPGLTDARSPTRSPCETTIVRDVVGRVRLGGRHDQILAVVLRHASDGGDRRRRLGWPLRDLVKVICCAASFAGSAIDFDLAHVARLHVDAADARHARDQRLDLIARQIVHRRRIAALQIV